MRDWVKEPLSVASEWTRAHVDWWTSVIEAVGVALPRTEAVDAARRRALELWEESVRAAIQAHGEWARMHVAAARAWHGAAPTAWEELIRQWVETQTELWEAWFAAVRSVSDSDPARDQLLVHLQDAAEREAQAQADWAQAWSESIEAAAAALTEQKR